MLPAGDPHSQGDSRVSCITGGVGMFPAGDPHSEDGSCVYCITGGVGMFPAGDSRSWSYTWDHRPGTPGPGGGPRPHVL